jgi:OmpA-OmpF porin, OOP family
MRCNPLRWVWGLLPLAIGTWLTVLVTHGRVEDDLKARAREALQKAGLGWAEPQFSGRDGVVTGQVTEESDPTRAVDIVSKVRGVRVADVQASLIDKVDTYRWGAELANDRIRLTGFVPNEETRKAIMGVVKANFPRAEIEDKMKLARGVPSRDAWLGGVGFALKQLATLRNGKAELTNLDLSVAGQAADQPMLEGVHGALERHLPQGVKLVEDGVVLSPEAKRRIEEAEARRRAEAAEAKRAAEAAEAKRAAEADEAKRAAEVAEAKRAAEVAEAKHAAEVSDARRAAEAADARRAGEAADARRAAEAADARRRAAEAEARRVAEANRQSNLAAEENRRSVTEVDRCQSEMSSILKARTIHFQRASAVIEDESLPTLDRLARAAESCPKLSIEIAGHTDAEGTPERNKRLSERRAAAVVTYLTQAGVNAGRLRAEGYGETVPVAPNDTPENRARNRRIEFVVKAAQ